MSLSLYLGAPGSGKSYGAIFFGLVATLKSTNRRIVTNIDGVKLDAISKYVGQDVSSRILVVTEEDVAKPDFFYHPDFAETSIVQPGDHVILDEAWRYFGTGTKPTERQMNFFRKHRHYVSADGSSIDIWLLTQQFNDVQRTVRGIADFTICMNKLKSLGKLGEKRYRVDYFIGPQNPERATPFKSDFGTYSPEIYALYESYVGGLGIEHQVDNRTNVFNSTFLGLPLFKLVLPLSVIPAAFGLYFVWSFFNPETTPLKPATSLTATGPVATPFGGPGVPPAPHVPGSAPTPAQSAQAAMGLPSNAPAVKPVEKPNLDLSKNEASKYRLVGIYEFNGMPVAVVNEEDGTLRYIVEFEEIHIGPAKAILVDKKVIASWTGKPLPANSKKAP